LVERLQTGPEYSCVNLGEEERDAPPERRHGVTELAGDAAHQPLSREPAQIVAHLPRRVGGARPAKQLRHYGPQAPIGEALGGAGEGAQGPQQRRHPRLPELQGRGRLALRRLGGEHEIREVGGGQPTVMGDLFGLQQARVDVLPQRAKVAEVPQPPSDPEVVGVVEGGRGAQRALLLEVLLDVAALVLDVQARDHALGHDAGREPARGRPGDLAREQQLQPIGAAEIEVLAQDFLEELSAVQRAREHLRAADLHLQDRPLVGEARGAILGRQGQRQVRQPPLEEGAQIRFAQAVADGLHGGRGRALEEPVVQRGEPEPAPFGLALGPFMPVETQLERVGRVATDLDERRPPLPIDDVDVVVVHVDGFPLPGEMHPGPPPGLGRVPRPGPLLRYPDEHDAGGGGEAVPVLLDNVILAFPLPELDPRIARLSHQARTRARKVVVISPKIAGEGTTRPPAWRRKATTPPSLCSRGTSPLRYRRSTHFTSNVTCSLIISAPLGLVPSLGLATKEEVPPNGVREKPPTAPLGRPAATRRFEAKLR